MAEPIRLLIADDHPIVREGLRAVLHDGTEFIVVADAVDGPGAVEAARTLRPDVVLLDLQMPGLTGIEAAKLIMAEMPTLKVLALTTFMDPKLVTECLKAGVHGYLVKDVDKLDLKRHIRTVLRGEAVIDPKVAGVLMARVRSGPATIGARAEDVLSPQQVVILRQVAQGHSNREIAEQIGLSENTVKGHVAEILHRLGTKSRVEAAIQASTRGWV